MTQVANRRIIEVEYADESGALVVSRCASEADYIRLTDGLDCAGLPWRRMHDPQCRVGHLGAP